MQSSAAYRQQARPRGEVTVHTTNRSISHLYSTIRTYSVVLDEVQTERSGSSGWYPFFDKEGSKKLSLRLLERTPMVKISAPRAAIMTRFSWFSSVPPGKHWEIVSIAFFHLLSNSSFTYHPSFDAIWSKSPKRVVKL
jgi:hypothetical protein